jgi:DNA adenine methylase
MKYMGSKAKYAKYLLPYILADRKSNQYYVEPFCGGCNMIDKVNGLRIAADINEYLIQMWIELSKGWIPPSEISRNLYSDCRNQYNSGYVDCKSYVGYVGFNGSYGGRFFDGGYAGVTTDKFGKERNYPLEAYNNIMKQLPKLRNVAFVHCDYQSLEIPNSSIIYCDKPYHGTKQYSTSKNFNHDHFWEWCRKQKENGHQIFISEYEAPNDFKCLVSLNAKNSLNTTKTYNTVEKLFTI